MDILNARAETPTADSLSAHLRAQLIAQYRREMSFDQTELANLIALAREDRRADKRRTYRIGELYLRALATRDSIAALEGRT
jgi:hypothetical protein